MVKEPKKERKPMSFFLLIIIGFSPIFLILISRELCNVIFKNSLYLHFYRGIVFEAIGFVFLMVCFYFTWQAHGEKTIPRKIVISILVIGFIYVGPRNTIKDIVFIGKEKYLTTACNINTLRIERERKIDRCYIYSNEIIDGKRIEIEMHWDQYRELKKEQEENNNQNIVVYYLPNTGMMLKYE